MISILQQLHQAASLAQASHPCWQPGEAVTAHKYKQCYITNSAVQTGWQQRPSPLRSSTTGR